MHDHGSKRTSYTVTSAGRDGSFGTEDDISAAFDRTINDNWGFDYRNAYYLVKTDGQVNILFHRWKGENFEYNDKDLAEAISGSEHFDLCPREHLSEAQIAQMNEAHGTLAAEADHAPIVLQVFTDKAL